MEEEPNPKASFCKRPNEPWKVLEFYSGIGGMRYSLMRSGVNAVVVEAFDINDKANDVYEHNFGHRPYQGNIQSLTAPDLDSYGAHAWLLSPPCQPYTRQGLQKQSGDARAFSFLNILELIPRTSRPPVALFVENVVGFETSDTRAKMVEVLTKAGFVTQEFILSPLQFCVPYSRPRYFCLAKRKPSDFQNKLLNNRLSTSPSPLFHSNNNMLLEECDQSVGISEKTIQSCEPIGNFLEFRKLSDQGDADVKFLDTARDSIECSGASQSQGEGQNVSYFSQYFVPVSLIERWGSAMDVVYPDSKRCCCFTKSYYRYVKGTGSLLATVQPEKRGKVTPLEEQRLRFFTPREVANLHSFPEDFWFPEQISLRQRYALLGNSLSTAVVAPLLQYLFTDPL